MQLVSINNKQTSGDVIDYNYFTAEENDISEQYSKVEEKVENNKYSEALEICNVVLKKEPTNVRFLMARAEISFLMGSYANAGNDLDIVCKINANLKKEPELCTLQALIFLMKGNNARYQEIMSVLIKADLPLDEYAKTALKLIQKDKYAEAIVLLDYLIAKKPDTWSYLNNRAVCYWQMGKYTQALKEVDSSMALMNENDKQQFQPRSLKLRNEILQKRK